MDGETPADGNFPMDEKLPDSDEATVEGDVLEDTPSIEDMGAEAEIDNDGGMELHPKDTCEAPIESDGDATTNSGEPAPECPADAETENRSGTGKNTDKVSLSLTENGKQRHPLLL